MNARSGFLSIKDIADYLQLENAFVILALIVGAWLIYKIFLRNVSEERHRNLRRHFRNLLGHLLIASGWLAAHLLLMQRAPQVELAERGAAWCGFFALFWGLVVFIKTCRIMVFEYLFIRHMKVPVPLLIVNLATLILSVTLGTALISDIFHIRLAPILATSAIFSVILGLALQETLVNLFAGVSLQFDKPYEIGDWVEVSSGTQKWIGQVKEVSWRATLLTGIQDEEITIPNRTVAQSQISNFSGRVSPFFRGLTFRIPFGSDLAHVKSALLRAVKAHRQILAAPEPKVIFTDTTESWILARVVYATPHYGAQWAINDRVIENCLAELSSIDVELASDRLQVSKHELELRRS